MPVNPSWAPPSIVTVPAASTRTAPALPEPAPLVSLRIPPPLTIDKDPVATAMVPAFPAPRVLVWIVPPLARLIVPAVTDTDPALPELPAACEEIPEDRFELAPSIASVPVATTNTSPPLPGPKVLLE